MSAAHNELVESLMETLLQQYRELRELILDSAPDASERLEAIGNQLQQIKATEKALQPAREEYRARVSTSSDRLQELSDKTVAIIEEVLPLLNELEQATKDAMVNLFPSVRSNVRGMLMQNAYGVRS